MKKKVYLLLWLVKIFVLAILIFANGTVSSQNAIVGTGFSTGWGGLSCPTGNSNFTYLGSSGFGSSYILTTTANGTGNQYWRFGVDWGGTTSQLAITHGSDIEVSPGTTYSLNTSCTTSGSMYYNVPDMSYNYIFKTKDAGSSPTGDFIFFEVQGTVRSISSVSQNPTDGNVDHGETVTVTATLDGSLSSGQGVYLRYTDDNFASSTVVEMSGSGTTYTAEIPASENISANNLTYYCFTSGDGMTINPSDADFYTINLNNNGGLNYSYTVNSIPLLLTSDFSNQSGTNGEKNYTVGFAFEPVSTSNYTFIASADAAGDRTFRFKNISGNERQPATDGTEITMNSATPFTSDIEDGSTNTYKITGANTGYRYVFRTDAGVTKIAIFEIQNSYISSISSLTNDILGSVYAGDDVTVTATTDSNLPTGQAVWLRYTTDSWSTSNCVKMTGSNTTWSADIPAQTASTTVEYYAFTSGDVSSISHTDADLYTINLDNNGGSNYSYSVSALTAPTLQSATAFDQNQIDLNWTQDATHNTVIVVVRQGAAPDDLSQGTAYAQGDGDINTAAGYILYKGTDDYSVTDLNNSGLTAGTHYYYKYFTVNGNHYSSAVSADATTYAFGDKVSVVEDGNWNTAATWSPSGVPTATDNVYINTNVTLDTDGTAANLTINSGQSLTSEAGQSRNINIADGGTFTNNGTYTANDGKITFLGAGTVSGTITFNDVEVQGGVDFGGNAALNGTLTINAGYLNNNSITYNSGSILEYATSYDIAANDNSWTSGETSSGSPQAKVPWNVVIADGTTVRFTDSKQYEMNGSLSIGSGSTFRLGTDGGDPWGDLALRGNFTNNGSFTHNSRSVKFIGTSLQQIGGSSAPTFAYLSIENANNVSLAQNITVANTLTFNSGKLILGNFNADLTTGSIAGYGTDKYVVAHQQGFLSMTATTTETVFPVGTETGYAPASMTKASGTEVFDVRVQQSLDNSTGKDAFAVNLQWTIDGVNSNPNVAVKLQWNESDENSLFDRNANVQMGRYISSAYTVDDVSVSGSGPDYSAELTGITDDLSAGIPFILANEVAFSGNGYVTAQNGRWQDGTTWQGGVTPTTDGDICAIAHHLTVESDLTSSGTIEFGNLTIYENKSLTVKTGGDIAVGNSTTSADIINYGSLKTDAGDASIILDGKLNNATGASVNMAGNGTLTFADGSTFTNNGSFTAGSGTVVFTGAGTVTGTVIFNDLDITGGNVNLGASASLNGVLTLSGTGDLITNSLTYNEGSVLIFDRNYDIANTVLWNNTASDGTAQAGVPWNVEIAADRSVQYTTTDAHYINGNLTISAPSSGTTLFDLGDGTNAGAFYLRGDFINNGTFTHRDQSVTFNGTELQSISGSPTFYDVVINNGANVSLANDLSVTNNISFTNGKIILGANNLTMSSGATFTGAGTSNYVVTNGDGYLIQYVDNSGLDFPVGTAFAYNPANLDQDGTAEYLGVRVQGSIDNAVNVPTDVVNVQWTIDESNGTSGSNDLITTFQWNATDEAGNFDNSGTVETRYYNSGYLPALPNASTVAGSDPWTATAGDNYSGNLSALPFIVANSSAFSGGIETIADGLWSSSSTWSGGVVPSTNADAAVIKHNVTTSMNWTVKSVSITDVGSLTFTSNNSLTLADGGAIANTTDANFIAGSGTVIFSGAGTISTGAITFNDIELNGSVSFGSNTTIGGTMTLNSGASVNTNPPVYGSGSTLKYAQGAVVTRGDEWPVNVQSGPGYPNVVQISADGSSNPTTLQENKANTDELFSRGLIIDGNCTYQMTSTATESLIVDGNVTVNGTMDFSSTIGGDLKLTGNLTKGTSGTINWTQSTDKGRAVFFSGTGTQNISGITAIPFLLITNTGTVTLLDGNLTVDGEGTNFISVTGGGSLDLNGNNLISTGSGNIDLGNTGGASVTGTGRVEFSSGNGSFTGTSSGTLLFDTGVTLAINGGTLTFPGTLDIVTLEGTLEIGDGATVSSFPTYGSASTLHYIKSGTFSVGPEWPAGSDQSDNIPFNVTLSEGSSASSFTLDLERYAFGSLQIDNNATFQIAPGTGHLSVANLIVNAGGEIILQSPSDMGSAGSLYISGTVTDNGGTMTAQRYLTGSGTNTSLYHYVSPPTDESNSQVFTNVHSSGNFNPNFYSYDEGFDGNPSGTTYDQWANFEDAWVYAHDGSSGSGSALLPASGYAFYSNESKMYSYQGRFLSVDQSTDLAYTSNDDDYFDGWNLIGNPYTCAIDWDSDAWTKTGIANTVYYWDGEAGQYKYYNGTTGSQTDDGENVVSGGSQYIPSGQAFFVHASQEVTGFTVPEAARVYNTQAFRKKDAPKEMYTPDYIKLQIAANNKEDETVVRFVPNAGASYDAEFDAYKMYSDVELVPHVFSVTENDIPMAINSLPVPENTLSVPLGVLVRAEGDHNFGLQVKTFELQNKHVYLEDTETGHYANLHQNPVYNFTAEGANEHRGRLVLHFTQNQAPTIASPLQDAEITYGNSLSISIPASTFNDPDAGDELTLRIQAENADWLNFNTNNGELSGTPTEAGSYTIHVIASDIFGEEAESAFTLTVNQATLYASANDAQRNYGEENPVFTAEYTGFVLNDDESAIDQLPQLSCTANAQSPAGEYTISISGGSDNNYLFEYTDGSLTVLPVMPEVSLTEIYNVGSQAATAEGEILSDGGTEIIAAGFCYALHSNPTLADSYVTTEPQNNLITADISGLQANTEYFVKAFAQNSEGIEYGNELSFTTTSTGVFTPDALSEVQIYPNPAQDFVTLTLGEEAAVDIRITNTEGKVLFEKNLTIGEEGRRINVAKLPAGQYQLEIRSEHARFVTRFVKQ